MKLYIFILLFLLTGCMVDNKTENSSNFDDFTEYNSENLSQNSLEITGTGRIIANSVFKSTRTNAHVLLQGQFLSSESYLILHLFFDDFEKDTGIQLKVKPDLENESIIIEYAEPLRPYRPLATIQKALAEDLSFVLRFETRNKLNNDRRILIWNDSLFYDSGIRRSRDGIIAGNADYDSRRNNHVFYTWGSGIHWGIHLYKVRMTQAKRETPYVLP